MTAENTGVPEDDDPFAYLYRADGAAAADLDATAPLPPQQQPGVPRTSYQQATQVGRTQYGQRAPYAPQAPAAQPQQYGYPQQAPAAQPQPASVPPQQPGSRAANRAGGGGGNRGVVLGVVAVVIAIAIGIGFALFNSKDKTDNTAGSTSSSTSQSSTGASSSPSDGSSASASPSAQLPGIADAAKLTLQGTQPNTQYTGAKSADGSSVPLAGAGQSISWTLTVPADGDYFVHVHYDNAVDDAKGALSANGGTPRDFKFDNFSGQKGDWTKGWVHSWGIVSLKAGQNTITLAGVAGQPAVSVDQVVVTTDKSNPWG